MEWWSDGLKRSETQHSTTPTVHFANPSPLPSGLLNHADHEVGARGLERRPFF